MMLSYLQGSTTQFLGKGMLMMYLKGYKLMLLGMDRVKILGLLGTML